MKTRYHIGCLVAMSEKTVTKIAQFKIFILAKLFGAKDGLQAHAVSKVGIECATSEATAIYASECFIRHLFNTLGR
jgi:hypothetical protein